MSQPRFFDDAEVRAVFTPELALSSQRVAFTSLGEGTAVLAPRLLLEGPDESVAFCYVARLRPGGAAFAKYGSVNPTNAERGIATISATVHVLDGETGRPVATIEATELTTVRTAAASALAVERLARERVRSLGIIGAGVQARAHARAVTRVRDFEEIRLAGRSLTRAKQLAEELAAELDVPVRVVSVETAAASDVLATCTTSHEAVIESSWVRPGATVVSVGAFAPDRMELPPSLLERAGLVVVDHLETTAEQSAPLVRVLAEGHVDRNRIAELGGVVVGDHPGRRNDEEIVVHLSVGLGIQDAAAADAILEAAGGQRFSVAS